MFIIIIRVINSQTVLHVSVALIHAVRTSTHQLTPGLISKMPNWVPDR